MLTNDQAETLLNEAELVFSQETVATALNRLAEEITLQLADKNPLVFCVMNGGLVFCGQLLPLLKFPLTVDYLHATRYGDETTGGILRWRVAPSQGVQGRTVLVVDDILDEGVTLAAIGEKLRSLGAKEVFTAVFADKQHGRPKPLTADFVGLQVPNRFLFGFGMDVQGAWRQLPAIYAMKDSA